MGMGVHKPADAPASTPSPNPSPLKGEGGILDRELRLMTAVLPRKDLLDIASLTDDEIRIILKNAEPYLDLFKS